MSYAPERTGAIIFSRMGSRRLPGKALLKIGGVTLIQRVINLTKMIDLKGPIILATSDLQRDDEFTKHAKNNGIEIFRGSEENVLDRALNAARSYDLYNFVRICGDRPFFDPYEIKDCIESEKNNNYDLISNAFKEKPIPGLTVEIVKTKALKKISDSTCSIEHFEHITKYIYENPKNFKIKSVNSKHKQINNLSLVVDTIEDLKKIQYISEKLSQGGFKEFDITRALQYAQQWKNL